MSRVFAISSLTLILLSTAFGQTVATVGSKSISSQDIVYRQATEAAYGNENLCGCAAVVGLINDAIATEVARLVGVDATETDITQLSQQVDTTSKAPHILAKVKEAFDEDTESYNKLYIAPKVVNKKLRIYYDQNVAPALDERQQAETVLQAVNDGQTLETAAGQSGLAATTFQVPKGGGQPGLPVHPLVQILANLQVGQVYDQVVEDTNSFKVIRLAGEEDTAYTVDSVTIAKPSLRSWLQERAEALSVTISDNTLHQQVTTLYPTLWWVTELLGD